MPQQRRFVPDRLPEAAAPNLPDDRRAAVLPDHDLDDWGTYRELDFLDLDLTGRTAPSVELEGCHLKGSDLSGSALEIVMLMLCVVAHRAILSDRRISSPRMAESSDRDQREA